MDTDKLKSKLEKLEENIPVVIECGAKQYKTLFAKKINMNTHHRFEKVFVIVAGERRI